MELYNGLEKTIKEAKTCDELQEAALGMLLVALANKTSYTDEEKMTESEKTEVGKFGEKLEKVIEERAKKLGCEDK